MVKITRLDKRLTLKPQTMHRVYALISEIDELKGQWKMGTNLSPQTLGRLKKSVIITSTGASTRIEGAILSDEEVEKLLGGLKIQKLKTRDEQEVAGYGELLTNIFDSHKNLKLTESTIKHFHKELLKYSDKDQGHFGDYKNSTNRVEAIDQDGKIVGVLFDPTPPHLVNKEMQELISWTNQNIKDKDVHSLIIIANFIFEFLAIHPFQDGNGRLSRILTNLLLLKQGYEFMPYTSHEKLVEDNKKDYYLALNKTQKTWKTNKEDLSLWLLFFLKIFLEQTKLANKLMIEESMEVLLSEKQLLIWNYILENKTITTKKIREDLKMPTPTIVQVLNKLLGMKKIERLGAGRGVRYKLIK
ncbi:MAG: Fic family protein [Patescibacteria group bacterium]